MFDLQAIKNEFSVCDCGVKHTLNIRDIQIGSKIVKDTGEILKKNEFEKRLLLVADKNTLKASDGIVEALTDFEITYKIYDDLRQADMEQVLVIESLLDHVDGCISVGTGSLNDICRYACAKKDKKLCLFATAPSMDGFASYNAPLTDGNFKITYPAKSPEVIIADTNILKSAPIKLKSAGFGDMVGKYVGLIDWQVSHLITGEYYCEKVANLTRQATDMIMALASDVTKEDEKSAEAVFKALLLTGIGMSFTKTSRPASGTEHILSHFWECKKLLKGQISDFHGRKVGVATLMVMKEYERLAKLKSVRAEKERIDWEDVYARYGPLKDEVIKLNTPDTITDPIDPKVIEQNWDKIVEIINSMPSYEQIYDAMVKAGCALTPEDIAVDHTLASEGFIYHPYMRRRLSLLRLSKMLIK